MARARNIKPGFFRNADLVELPFEARLLFIGLWTIADRKGRLEDRPKQIKMELFPADNLDCDELLNELEKIGVVARYQHGETRYLQVVNFDKHQNPHKDEKASSIPGLGEDEAENVDDQGSHGAGTVLAPCTSSADTVAIGLIPDSRFLIPDSLNTPLTPQGGKRGRKVEAEKNACLPGFTVFWAAYPRKVGKQAAMNAWVKLCPDEALQARILGALAAQKPHLDNRENGRFIPHPSTWLNAGQWDDELPGGKPAPIEADGRVWWQIAGFGHPAEAASARCHIVNYREFRDGKRIPLEEVA
jgi:hypothetical protein